MPEKQFVQVKRKVWDTPLCLADATLFMACVLHLLENDESEPLQDSPETDVRLERGMELGWVAKDGRINPVYFSNSRYDRDFKAKGEMLSARSFRNLKLR